MGRSLIIQIWLNRGMFIEQFKDLDMSYSKTNFGHKSKF